MRIRFAELRDARAIAEVHVASWQAAYRGILPAEKLDNLSIENRHRQWGLILGTAEGTRRNLVCEIEDRVVAFSSFGPNRDPDCEQTKVAELWALYALKEHWGSGCGRALWLKTMQSVRDELMNEIITLWVLTDNHRARRFYEKAGFRPDGATKDIMLLGATLGETRYRRALP
jgi:ribosomal protein S18 acetylase RimI-like enzyme